MDLHRTSRRTRLIWADAVYAGKLADWAARLKMTLCIVARRNRHAFEVLPRRWVVERTFAWISKHRRTVRDYERLPASHEAMILWAMTALMAGRLAQPDHLSNTHQGAAAAAPPGVMTSARRRARLVRTRTPMAPAASAPPAAFPAGLAAGSATDDPHVSRARTRLAFSA